MQKERNILIPNTRYMHHESCIIKNKYVFYHNNSFRI